jgi:hypothetical protein
LVTLHDKATVLCALHRLQAVLEACRQFQGSLLIFSSLSAGLLFPLSTAVGWDVGMIQADALGVDQEKTLESLKALGDASSTAILIKRRPGLPSRTLQFLLLVTFHRLQQFLLNDLELHWFGWEISVGMTFMTPLGGRFAKYAAAAKAQYQQGELLLRCPFSLAMDWGLREHADRCHRVSLA